MRKRPHVARPLHVVLATQRIHAHTVAAKLAGSHRQIRNPQHHRAALAMLGHSEAEVDRTVACAGVQPCRLSQLGSGYARVHFRGFRRLLFARDELPPLRKGCGVAAFGHKRFVHEALHHDHVRQRVDHRHVGSGAECEVVRCLNVRAANDVDPTRVDDDQFRPVAKPALHAGGEDRVRVGRVRTNDNDHISVRNRAKVLRSRRGAERLLQPVASR